MDRREELRTELEAMLAAGRELSADTDRYAVLARGAGPLPRITLYMAVAHGRLHASRLFRNAKRAEVQTDLHHCSCYSGKQEPQQQKVQYRGVTFQRSN